jgi:hypothetical protein
MISRATKTLVSASLLLTSLFKQLPSQSALGLFRKTSKKSFGR